MLNVHPVEQTHKGLLNDRGNISPVSMFPFVISAFAGKFLQIVQV